MHILRFVYAQLQYMFNQAISHETVFYYTYKYTANNKKSKHYLLRFNYYDFFFHHCLQFMNYYTYALTAYTHTQTNI